MGQRMSCPRNAPKEPETPLAPGTPPLEDRKSPASVSFSAVDEIVDDFMSDSAINNPLLPDFVERSIYRNVIKLLLGVLGRVLDTAQFGFLGHNITMKLSPQCKTRSADDLPV